MEPGSNEAYFEQWRALKRQPALRAYLAMTEARYERRVKRFGYSLRDPGGAAESLVRMRSLPAREPGNGW